MAELLLDRPATEVTDDHTLDGLDRLGLALADPTRRAVLLRLADASWTPSELADDIGISRPKLSNHLACLRGCGLIAAERTGRQLHYQLVSPALRDVMWSLVDIARTLTPCDVPAPTSDSAA